MANQLTGSSCGTILGMDIPDDWHYSMMTDQIIHRTGVTVDPRAVARERPRSPRMLELLLQMEVAKATSDMVQYHAIQQQYANMSAAHDQSYQAGLAQQAANQQYQSGLSNAAQQNAASNMLGQMGYAAMQPPTQPKTGSASHSEDMAAVMMRMRWKKCPFDFFQCYQKKDGDRIILLIADDKSVTLEDGGALFPSDKLVGQLRLLQGALTA